MGDRARDPPTAESRRVEEVATREVVGANEAQLALGGAMCETPHQSWSGGVSTMLPKSHRALIPAAVLLAASLIPGEEARSSQLAMVQVDLPFIA